MKGESANPKVSGIENKNSNLRGTYPLFNHVHCLQNKCLNNSQNPFWLDPDISYPSLSCRFWCGLGETLVVPQTCLLSLFILGFSVPSDNPFPSLLLPVPLAHFFQEAFLICHPKHRPGVLCHAARVPCTYCLISEGRDVAYLCHCSVLI